MFGTPLNIRHKTRPYSVRGGNKLTVASLFMNYCRYRLLLSVFLQGRSVAAMDNGIPGSPRQAVCGNSLTEGATSR
jgi:hypothetical protein